jgi:2',3'-cyclic-nucleotide 2'-phosphodiesterase (5'-nucleotidase family)
LSNIVDTDTGRQPDAVQRFVTFEKMGIKIAVIGLVEKDWIATIRQYLSHSLHRRPLMSILPIASWPHTFQHRSMVDTAIELSKELRDPNGPHKVDLIIALTHCRLPNVRSFRSARG